MRNIFHFHIVIYTFITPERCEYLNTICEVLVYDLRACLWSLVERLFVVITLLLVLNDP